jgi:alpha-ribazole phosphatase
MKLILLRHEERDMSDPRFFTELTIKGKENTIHLVEQLSKENIDVIFSSPFLRTLQTIYPYANHFDKKINVEYGLYEYIHNPIFHINNWYHSIIEYQNNDQFYYINNIINQNYKSIIQKKDFTILENQQFLENRIILFFDYLRTNYHDKTVLLVSHMATINMIKNIYLKKTNLNDYFKMGSYEIYNLD